MRLKRWNKDDIFFVVVVQLLSCCQTIVSPWTAALQASLSFTISQSLLKCLLNWWCHPTISSSVAPFSCPQSLPASGSFPMSRLFAQDMEGGQSIGASASVLPMNIQEWLLLELTGLISLLSRKLSRVFSSTTIQNLKLLGSQPSLWPICTWLLQQQYLSLWGPLLEKWFIYFLICYLGLAQLFFQGASVF